MTTREKTNHPGIWKVTTGTGQIKYRLIIDMGISPDGKRDQRCETFARLTDAKSRQSEIKNSKDKGILVRPSKITFEEMCQKWLNSRHDVREITRIGYEQVLKPVRAQLGTAKVQDLTRSRIEAVIRSLRDDRGLSHRSLVYTLGAIKQILNYGITEGCLAINVASSVKAPRKQHGDTKAKSVWTPEELIQFRTIADQHEWAAAWRLTLSGLRRSEVLGMQWSAVDLAAGEVRVQAGRVLLDKTRTATDDPKSSASHRTVAVEDMHSGTVALLRSLKARQAADRLVLGAGYIESGYVLVDPLGEPVKPYTYSDRFEILCRQAAVPIVQLHSVRHTLATIMHRSGTAPSDAAALLGHTVAVHLATYVTPTERGARAAASGLGAAISGLR